MTTSRHGASGNRTGKRLPVAAPVVLAFIVALCCLANRQTVRAEDFDWRNIDGQDFTTPTHKQFESTCWAFATVGALEAKYKITRGDPTFSLDLSEYNVVYDSGAGTPSYGFASEAVDWFRTTGVVLEQDYPLTPGWQDRVCKLTANENDVGSSIFNIKNYLKNYGPLVMNITVDNDWYPNPIVNNRGTHSVVIVGYHDDAGMLTGGYWIVKNSWIDGNDWREVPYGRGNNFCALTGAAYYTAALGSATWDVSPEVGFQGGGGTWSAGDSLWTADGAALKTWRNGEDAAVFSSGGSSCPVTVTGTVSAHSLTFNTGATGYTLTGGTLIVTHGGISTQENVTINSPITVGAPQQWNVAAGKTLDIGNTVNTNFSDLTVAGDGNTNINGPIVGKGGLTKAGGGQLVLATSNTYVGSTTIQGGTLKLAAGASIRSSFIDMQGGKFDVSAAPGGYTVDGSKILRGYGTIAGDITLQCWKQAGVNPGVLNVGNITFDANSLLEIGLGGTTPGAECDKLIAGGKLSLSEDSYLSIFFRDNYWPEGSATYDILDFGSISGMFGGVDLPMLDDGRTWDSSHLYIDGTITLVPEPAMAFLLAAVGLWFLRNNNRSRGKPRFTRS
jgi:autotransporter-associated beta strand protein